MSDEKEGEIHKEAERQYWKHTITVGLITAAVSVVAVIIAEVGASNRTTAQISTSEAGQSTRQSQQLDTAQAAESTRDHIHQSTEQAGFSTRDANRATQEKKHLNDVVSYTATAEYRDTEVAAILNPSIPQATITPHPTLDLGDPLQSIEAYYSNLNKGNYLAAWNMLHAQFRSNCCDDDLDVYIGFWSTAGLVSVIELEIDSQVSQNSASVLVRLYWDQDGYERSYRYDMVYSLEKSAWLIRSVGGA